ncbi:MAG: phosphoribosylformylglycinamidine synthase subunit PurS [Acidobacteria bacterium]|nr:phosphoribosylformylglycinamidine synthase subunit PurS [Acidobacteriota bacterium]MCB9396437.1 phosphoribosylformylglycinamidine synthase subunit PurS [Acidobacteriota bacterium]
MSKVQVIIRLKNGVLDPQGKTAQHALQALGFQEAAQVRIGKFIELELDGANPDQVNTRVREMCEKLLANPVIEDFEILGG